MPHTNSWIHCVHRERGPSKPLTLYTVLQCTCPFLVHFTLLIIGSDVPHDQIELVILFFLYSIKKSEDRNALNHKLYCYFICGSGSLQLRFWKSGLLVSRQSTLFSGPSIKKRDASANLINVLLWCTRAEADTK